MFCFQCQETAKNQGCTIKGVCGKEGSTAILQDLLIYNLKGIGVIANKAKEQGVATPVNAGEFVSQALFTTITNVNFNDSDLIQWIKKAQVVKKELYESVKDKIGSDLHESATWYSDNEDEYAAKAETVGVLSTERSCSTSFR